MPPAREARPGILPGSVAELHWRQHRHYSTFSGGFKWVKSVAFRRAHTSTFTDRSQSHSTHLTTTTVPGNTKHQAPNTRKAPISKHRSDRIGPLELGRWSFSGVCPSTARLSSPKSSLGTLSRSKGFLELGVSPTRRIPASTLLRSWHHTDIEMGAAHDSPEPNPKW